MEFDIDFKKLFDSLRTLRPKFWVMLGTYNKDWDNFINEALDKGHEIKRCKYGDGSYSKRGTLAGEEIWLANYPCGYATYGCTNLRPSRRTILRVRSADTHYSSAEGFVPKKPL